MLVPGWEKYCYHKGRNSIMINSNYYVLDGSYTVPTSLRNARAAQMLHNMLKYNLIVEREKIEPMLIQGMVPLDMSQHRRMFATTRIPGRDCDHVKHYEYTDIKHIAVLCRGHFYKVDVIRKVRCWVGSRLSTRHVHVATLCTRTAAFCPRASWRTCLISSRPK